MDVDKFEDKINEVKKAFEEMTVAYKECEDFEKIVAFPKKFNLNEKEKLNEKRLLEELKDCIDKWEDKLNDLRNGIID